MKGRKWGKCNSIINKIYLKKYTRATIKDTWTKSKGRMQAGEGCGFGWGGVERWGENADNCN